ncbi:hypothetical protein GGF37_002886 [Kickxella alabastrina]|nr:hypothetical protein GGF37_002886 [Kickxella alabastrina]
MAPFSSSGPGVSIEFDDTAAEYGRYDPSTESTHISGRVLVRVIKPVPVHSVCVEFIGEESVWLRAWVPLSSKTLSREVLRQRTTLHASGVLSEGVHIFSFSIAVPAWVPSSLDRDMCRIRYVVRAVVERTSFLGGGGMSSMGGNVGGAGQGAWVHEEEVSCRRIRASRRLARRKRIDQSVGCPNGSCHVRFWGSISRDVVRPGAQIKVDVVAHTSDARFGLRMLVANFAEHVLCHVQVKGEERFVNKITNLVTYRLDSLAEDPSEPLVAARGDAELHRESLRSDPGHSSPALQPPSRSARSSSAAACGDASDAEPNSRQQITRGMRKTRSRLAVLLRSTSPAPPLARSKTAGDYENATASLPPVPSLPMALLSPTPTPTPAQSVVRQIRASQVIQLPLGLSQFSSEFVSREYRLMLVAEVAPLEELSANGNSANTLDAAGRERPTTARRRLSESSTTSSSSSASSKRSFIPPYLKLKRRLARSQMSLVPFQQADAPHPRWSVSEQASAIAGWTVDVVDHFDVRFDELVVHGPGASDAVARSMPRDPEIYAGEYTFVPPTSPASAALGSVVSPAGTVTTLDAQSQSQLDLRSNDGSSHLRRKHHRRASSGLVGFILRGFRSSTPSSPSPSVSPRLGTGSLPTTPQVTGGSSAIGRLGRHMRSASSSAMVGRTVGRGQLENEPELPTLRVSGPQESSNSQATHIVRRHPDDQLSDTVMVMHPLSSAVNGGPLHPTSNALPRPLRLHSSPFEGNVGDNNRSSVSLALAPSQSPTQTQTQAQNAPIANGSCSRNGIVKSPVLRRRPPTSASHR